MKSMKKVLSAVLALAMIMSMIVLPVSAEDAALTIRASENKTFSLDTDQTQILNFTAPSDGWYILYDANELSFGFSAWTSEGANAGGGQWNTENGYYNDYVIQAKAGESYELCVNNFLDDVADYDIHLYLAECYSALSLDCTQFTGTVDDCLELNALTEGALAYEYITWTSSNEDVVFPEYRLNNYIAYRLTAPGTTTITATTESGLSATCEVTVTAAGAAAETIAVGESKQLTVGPGVDVSVSFTASESGSYIFYRPTADAVMGQLFGPEGVVEGWESWADDAHQGAQFPAEAGVTYTYTLWHDTSDTVETSVTLIKVEEEQVETIAAGESKKFKLEDDEEIYFHFTPTESDRYVIYSESPYFGITVFKGTTVDDSAKLKLDSWRNSPKDGYMLDAEAGQTYTICAKNTRYAYSNTFRLNVEHATKYDRYTISEAVCGMVGDRLSIYVNYSPMGATESVTWTIDDPTVASFSDISDQSAYMELIGPGTTTVTVTTASGLTDSCTLFSKVDRPFEYGQTLELTLQRQEFEPLLFTAPASGRFIFYTPAEGNLQIEAKEDGKLAKLESTSWKSDDGAYVGTAFSMAAGRVYRIFVKNSDHDEPITTSVSVFKTENYVTFGLDKNSYSGYPGSSATLAVVGTPEDANESVTWKSSNESIVTIEYSSDTEADIILLDTGIATITATTESGLTATCTVVVQDPVELKLNQAHTETVEVASFIFSYFTAPAAGTYSFYAEGDGYYAYSVLNGQTGSTVSGTQWYRNGVNGVDCYMRAGQTYIYLVFNANDTATTYHVTVGQPTAATGLTLMPEQTQVYSDSYFYLESIFQPVLAIGETITWKSSDEKVAKFVQTVTQDGYTYHEFQALSAGTATITATSASGFKATCTVTVAEPAAIKPGSYTTAALNPYEFAMYTFTPERNGTYILYHHVDDPCVVGWEIDPASGTLAVWEDGDYAGIEAQLKAGQTYRLVVQSEAEAQQAFPFYLAEGSHEHTLTLVPEKAATYVEPGNIAHYTCTICGALFADAEGKTELTEDAVVIPKLEGAIEIKMNESKQVLLPMEGSTVLLFTAPKDGTYAFACCDNAQGVNVDIETIDGEVITVDELRHNKWGNTDFYVTLTGGETYVLMAYTGGLEERQCILAIGQYGKATELNLSAEQLTLYPYMDFALHTDFGSVFAEEEAVTFTSSDPAVADINPNYEEETGFAGPGFNAYKPGKTVITATSENGLTATCEVTVKAPESIGLGEHTTPVLDNGDFITYCFTPEVSGDYNLYLTSEMDFVLQWSSLKEHERELWKGEDYVGFRSYLEAGETYTIYVENFYQQGAKTFTFWLAEAPHAHTPAFVAEQAAGYAQPGTKAHYACTCGALFADAEGTKEVTAEELTIPQLIQIADGKTEISADVLTDAAENAAGGVVTIPVADAGEVKYAQLPAAALAQVAAKDIGLTLEMTAASVTMNPAALAAVVEYAGDAAVTLEVTEIPRQDLTESQMAAIEKLEQNLVTTIRAQLLVNNQPIATEQSGGFGKGKVTVKIPVQLATDEFTVLYLAEDGSAAVVETVSYADGILTMELDHFSTYAILQKCLPGDTNVDGKISILDLMRLANFFAGKDVELNQANADVNGDGKVTILDLMRLANYFAGKDVTLGKP